MESVLAIGVGLVLRIILDVATDNDDRVSGVLVGLWEGVVLNHFVRRMPRSFDPYLGFGFRIFVDFLFTQSISRLALVALWSLVGMLLADIAPSVWRDSGLRHLYRQVRKDVRHVKRAVPRIRIENDLPRVRLFATKSRSTSSDASGSARSDRATPARSLAPSPAPTPGPGRRPGRSPPGTFPDVSGWSETNTDVSDLRERVVTTPGPSPSLIPSREHAAYERIDTTYVSTSQTRSTSVQDITVTITQSQNKSMSSATAVDATKLGAAAVSRSFEPIDDLSRHNPPVIPDDWVDIDHPPPAKPNEPVPPFRPDSDSTPDPLASPSPPTLSRPVTIFDPPPVIDVLPDIPDVDHANRASLPLAESHITSSRLPDQKPEPPAASSRRPAEIPLPESRAASEIGGVYDQPHPRSTLHDSLRYRVHKATSEIGVDPKSLAPIAETHSIRSQSSTSSWTSWTRTKFKQSVNVTVPEPPPKETQEESSDHDKPNVGSTAQGSEPQTSTPAQVDPPPNILAQPGDVPPLLLASELGQQQRQSHSSKPDQPPASAGIDSSPTPLLARTDVKDTTGPTSAISPLDILSPTRTPPPPFTEFAGVPEGLAAGEGPPEEDPAMQDEAPTELTKEQRAAEEKRVAFLLTQVQELEGSRTSLQKKLDKEDDPTGSPAKTILSDLEDAEQSLASIKARMQKRKFSDPPLNPLTKDISLANKSVTEVQFAITSAVLDVLLVRDDAGPMTIQFVINKQKPLKAKAKEAKDAVMAFAKRHQFSARFENATPGIINITF